MDCGLPAGGGTLDAVKVARLRGVDFAHDLWERDWDKWFSELLLFKQRMGHCAIVKNVIPKPSTMLDSKLHPKPENQNSKPANPKLETAMALLRCGQRNPETGTP